MDQVEIERDDLAVGIGTRVVGSWNAVMEGALAAAVAHPNASALERPALLKQVRKATKTGRAMIRLIAAAMPDEVRIGAEHAMHDAASLLSAVRDRDAMTATIDGLLDGKLDDRADRAKAVLHDVIAIPPVGDDELAFEVALVRRAAALLSRGADLIGRVADESISARDVGNAMAATWRKARRRANRAWECPSDADEQTHADPEAAHEARKAASRLVHQLSLVEPDLTKPLRRFRQQLRKATAALGDEHDLALLAERIALHRDRLGPTFADAVLNVCRRGQMRMRENAGVALAEAMTMTPRELGRRIRRRYADGSGS